MRRVDLNPHSERYFELGDLIADTPARTLEGVAIQAHLLRDQIRPDEQSEMDLAARLITNICDSLDTLTATATAATTVLIATAIM